MSNARAAPTPLDRIDAHYRKFLAGRWLEFTWRAAIWTGIAFGLSQFIFGGFHLSSLPLAFALGLLAFPLTVYPILWTRRTFVVQTSKPSASTSLAALVFAGITDSRNIKLLTSYIVSGTISSGIYCLTLSFQRPTVELGFFSPTPRHPWHLNERFLFLNLGQALFMLCLGLRDVFGGHLQPIWPTKKMPFGRAVQNTLLTSIPPLDQALTTLNPVTLSIATSSIYTLTYFFLRPTIWHFLLTHFGGLSRAFMINFARTSRNTITWSLLLHLLALQASYLFIIQMPKIAMMAYITQPLNFSAFTAKSPVSPNRYLIIALRSQDPYYINFTLMELLRVCRIPERRKALFEDVSSTPNTTTELWQSLTSLLEKADATIINRGGTRLPAAAPARPSPPSAPDPRTIPIKQGDIFRPVVKKKSTIESIVQNVLEGPGKPPLQTVVPVPTKLLQVGEKAKQLEVKAIEGAQKQIQDTQKLVHEKIEGVKGSQEVINEITGAWERIHQSFSGVFIEKYLGSIPQKQQIQWIVDIIAVLAVASTEEDTYGNVQKLLPNTFSTFLQLRQSIRSYQAELADIKGGPSGRSQKIGIESAQNQMEEVVDSLNGGLRRICEKFGDSLKGFRLSPAVAGALSDLQQS